jgi:hypothetical protein
LTPIALVQIVRGDSARLHARAYEAGIRQSVRYTFASALAGASAIWLGRAHDCRLSINLGTACGKSGEQASLEKAWEPTATDHRIIPVKP